MSSNIIFYEDDLDYLEGQYRYVLQSLRSHYKDETFRALLLTRNGEHLGETDLKERCEIEEDVCPDNPEALGSKLDSFVDGGGGAINIVYIQDGRPIKKAIEQETLALISSRYPIAVLDWEYYRGITGGTIAQELRESQKLLIACSDPHKHGELVQYFSRSLFFRALPKASPGSFDGGMFSALCDAIDATRRAGKSRRLISCLGNTMNPLGKHVHPSTTLALFGHDLDRFRNNVEDARDFFKTKLASLLEPEERDEFEGTRAEWSFDSIDALFTSSANASIPETLFALLDGGLKRKFRINLRKSLPEWANGRSIKIAGRIPDDGDAYIYEGGLLLLFELLGDGNATLEAIQKTDGAWSKYLIRLTQSGAVREDQPAYNNLLVWSEAEIRDAFTKNETQAREGDLSRLRRLLSSYGPILFERVNSQLDNSQAYVALRIEPEGIAPPTDIQTQQEFETLPLSTGNLSSDKGLRFSFLLWSELRGSPAAVLPSQRVPPRIGGRS